MKDSTPNTRLALFIKSKGLTQSQLAAMLNTSQPTLSAILAGSRKLSRGMVARIETVFPDLNKDWLYSGEGGMQKSVESNAELVGVATKAIDEVTVPVRFFEVTPTATFQEFCVGVSEEPDTTYIIPRPNEQLDESYCVFEVYGDSMAPQIQSRARVLCQEISPSRWHYLSECVIVIAYKDRFVIKRLDTNHLSTENYMVLSSDNPDFPVREKVWLADIRAIFKAKRIISSDIV